MTTSIRSLMAVIWLTLSLTGVVWSTTGQACSDPSPDFVYDPFVWQLSAKPSETIEVFLNRRYGAGNWQFNPRVARVFAPDPRDEERRMRIALNQYQCTRGNCDKFEVLGIAKFSYIKENRSQQSGPKIFPIISVERWSPEPSVFEIRIFNMPYVRGAIMAVREVQGSSTKWHVYQITTGFWRSGECGWTVYVESDTLVPFYRDCYYSILRSGSKPNSMSAICRNRGITERTF